MLGMIGSLLGGGVSGIMGAENNSKAIEYQNQQAMRQLDLSEKLTESQIEIMERNTAMAEKQSENSIELSNRSQRHAEKISDSIVGSKSQGGSAAGLSIS